MVIRLRADFDVYERMIGGSRCWFTARYQIRAGSANCIFDDVRDEGCEHQAGDKLVFRMYPHKRAEDRPYKESKYCDMALVYTRPRNS